MKFPKVQTFSILNTFAVVKRALSVLNSRDRHKAGYIVLVYAFLGILDIAAVFVFGLVGSLAVSGISSSQPGTRVNSLLEILGIAERNLQSQV